MAYRSEKMLKILSISIKKSSRKILPTLPTWLIKQPSPSSSNSWTKPQSSDSEVVTQHWSSTPGLKISNGYVPNNYTRMLSWRKNLSHPSYRPRKRFSPNRKSRPWSRSTYPWSNKSTKTPKAKRRYSRHQKTQNGIMIFDSKLLIDEHSHPIYIK